MGKMGMGKMENLTLGIIATVGMVAGMALLYFTR